MQTPFTVESEIEDSDIVETGPGLSLFDGPEQS